MFLQDAAIAVSQILSAGLVVIYRPGLINKIVCECREIVLPFQSHTALSLQSTLPLIAVSKCVSLLEKWGKNKFKQRNLFLKLRNADKYGLHSISQGIWSFSNKLHFSFVSFSPSGLQYLSTLINMSDRKPDNREQVSPLVGQNLLKCQQ